MCYLVINALVLQTLFIREINGLQIFFLASTCKEDLVDAVTDDKLTASSIYNGDYSADKARLSSSGWSPDPSEGDPWIQVLLSHHHHHLLTSWCLDSLPPHGLIFGCCSFYFTSAMIFLLCSCAPCFFGRPSFLLYPMSVRWYKIYCSAFLGHGQSYSIS